MFCISQYAHPQRRCRSSQDHSASFDDGLASHLLGLSVPADLTLVSTKGTPVKLSELPGLTIVFCYLRTGAPGEAVPEEWNNTPGARGCTGGL